MPLHIFEARYRQMVAHCVEGEGRFGLLYHDPDREGPFEIEAGRVGCVARIVQFEPIPDGRSTVLLQGEERFRIVDGIESESLYYEALVEELQDDAEDPETLRERTENSAHLFHRVLDKISGEPQPPPPLEAGRPLSFQLAQWIRIDPRWQQDLLEMVTEQERLDAIDDLLNQTLEMD